MRLTLYCLPLSLRSDLAQRVQYLVLDELSHIYRRLKRQQEERDAVGMMPRRATRTLLENKLVVEARRRIDVHQIADNVLNSTVT